MIRFHARWPRLGILALLVSACLAAPAGGQATPGENLEVREILLENGMRILILPREGAPTVSFTVRFGLGGVHERLGTTGIAHLLEHMLFKGTTTIGTRDPEAEQRLFPLMDAAHDSLLLARVRDDRAEKERLVARVDALEDSARAFVESNEFDRILSRAGAQGLNATTTNEATIYFVELPSNRTELWFALEADRMSNPVFREYYSERDVVTEERRMRIESVPGGVLYETHLATAFTMHPYGVPVVGYMSDLETLSRRDVESYYRRFYGPNNAVVAIVGDLDPDQVEGWTRQYLGSIPRGDDPPPVLAVEPEQRGERRIEVEWDAEPQLRLGWHVPSSMDDDAPALAILTSLLTGGRTSRLLPPHDSRGPNRNGCLLLSGSRKPLSTTPPDRCHPVGPGYDRHRRDCHLRRDRSARLRRSDGDRADEGKKPNCGWVDQAYAVEPWTGVPARRISSRVRRLEGDVPIL